MLFVLYCRDRADAADLRRATRPDHLAFVAGQSGVRVAGPLLGDDGETMIGSLFLLDADDADAVRRFNGEDPYTRAGLWERVEIHPMRFLAGDGLTPGA